VPPISVVANRWQQVLATAQHALRITKQSM